MRSRTAKIISWRKGLVCPSRRPWVMARRIILRRTYPRPSLEGRTPSEMRNVAAREWSAMTRREAADLCSAELRSAWTGRRPVPTWAEVDWPDRRSVPTWAEVDWPDRRSVPTWAEVDWPDRRSVPTWAEVDWPDRRSVPTWAEVDWPDRRSVPT